LVNFDWRIFRDDAPFDLNGQFIPSPIVHDLSLKSMEINPVSHSSIDQFEMLENHFRLLQEWPQSLKVDNTTMIVDLKKFVNNHLATARRNKGNYTFDPYIMRLQQARILTESLIKNIKQ